MKKFLLFILIIIFYSSFSYAKRTGCEGDCENGNGTWTYTDQTVYKGEWVNSKKQGKGIEPGQMVISMKEIFLIVNGMEKGL